MNPRAQAFRRLAAQVCSRKNVPYHCFAVDYSLDDILFEATENKWSAAEIAITVLADCCVEDGRFNNFQVGFQAAVLFLKEQLGALPGGEEQAWRDLYECPQFGRDRCGYSWLGSDQLSPGVTE